MGIVLLLIAIFAKRWMTVALFAGASVFISTTFGYWTRLERAVRLDYGVHSQAQHFVSAAISIAVIVLFGRLLRYGYFAIKYRSIRGWPKD